MKNYRVIISGAIFLFSVLVARPGPIREQVIYGASLNDNSDMFAKTKDTSGHIVPCVKIHHPIFQKTPTVSVNSDGKHYLQVFDSKGAKLNEFTFMGKRYKLDTHAMSKGSYTIYVFDEHRKLLDLKPMIVK